MMRFATNQLLGISWIFIQQLRINLPNLLGFNIQLLDLSEFQVGSIPTCRGLISLIPWMLSANVGQLFNGPINFPNVDRPKPCFF